MPIWLRLGDLYTDHTSSLSTACFQDEGEFSVNPVGTGTVKCGPGFYHWIAGAGATAPNDVISACEYMNQDYFHFPDEPMATVRTGDAYLGLPIRCGVQVMPTLAVNTPATGAFWALGVGSPWPNVSYSSGTGGLAEVDTAMHWRIQKEYTTNIWSLVVVNKWAAAGSRRFTKVLGTSAALNLNGSWDTYGSGSGGHLELIYVPNFGIEAYVDGLKIGTMTDADCGGNTPFAQIYTNRKLVGSTIKGVGVMTFAGALAGVNMQVKTRWSELYREAFGTY